VVGNRTRVRVVKNKVAPPFKEVQFDIIYGEGISRDGEIMDLATDLNILEKMGTWYSYGDTRIGQGRENAKTFIKENPEIREEIVGKIQEQNKLPKAHKEVGDGTE
jgi:recombination protein RecA